MLQETEIGETISFAVGIFVIGGISIGRRASRAPTPPGYAYAPFTAFKSLNIARGDDFAAMTRRIRNVAASWWKFCPKFKKNSRFISFFSTDCASISSEDQRKKVFIAVW